MDRLIDSLGYSPNGLILTPESDESTLFDVVLDMLTVETGNYSGISNDDDMRLINDFAVDLMMGKLPLDVYCDAVAEVVGIDPYYILDTEIVLG